MSSANGRTPTRSSRSRPRPPSCRPDLDVLAIVHPENLTPKLQFAIDQFLLARQARLPRRRPLLALLQAPGRPGGDVRRARSPTSRATCPSSSAAGASPTTRRRWSATSTTRRRSSCPTSSHAALPGLDQPRPQDNFNSKALPTAQLEPRPSSSRRAASRSKPGTRPHLHAAHRDLGQGRRRSPAAALQFAQPEEVARQVTPSGKRTIAALVTGKFKTRVPRRRAQGRRAPADDKKDEKPAAKPAAGPALAQGVQDHLDPHRRRRHRLAVRRLQRAEVQLHGPAPPPSRSTTTSPSPPTRSTSSRARAT